MPTYEIRIKGTVQGVGFRPFIYRLAKQHGLTGDVVNRNDGVIIRLNDDMEKLEFFISDIEKKAPAASSIDEISHKETGYIAFHDFIISKSDDVSGAITGISPDIAVCDDCLRDMKDQAHRIDYPLVNCTNCGPRFSIIRSLPYDRSKTTMKDFPMCDTCMSEYSDLNDRRFHAQPVACNHCGPQYRLLYKGMELTDIRLILSEVAALIEQGHIGAVKGTGGYHLICDARNEKSVEELRKRKQRDSKPFAVMCRDFETASALAYLSNEDEKILNSWQAPVVIAASKDKLPHGISNGLNTTGLILPYMPFHYLLFKELETDVTVFTSANLSDEPVIKDDDKALEKLSGIADFFVSYNRKIHNRTDDSLVKTMDAGPVMIRRSRGYVPAAVKTPYRTEGVFAAGAELVNSFAMGKGEEAIMGQYIGDLKNKATFDYYRESYDLFKRLLRFEPSQVVCDLHPDYLSSVFASELATEYDIPLLKVQHHHAHIVSCMADNKLAGEELIGLSMDGVGLGTDGRIWGGEVMIASESDFSRLLHFDYVPIMGADRVSYEPWRSGLSYLLSYLDDAALINELPSFKSLDDGVKDMYLQGLDKRINTHEYSSAGRLFDAVSSIIGLSNYSGYHAEAPMKLESLADSSLKGSYDFDVDGELITFKRMIEQIVEDVLASVSQREIASRFHNTFVNALALAADRVKAGSGIRKLVLSGGTFQNSYIVNNLVRRLEKEAYIVYLHKNVPPNDGGLALGQLVAGSKRLV